MHHCACVNTFRLLPQNPVELGGAARPLMAGWGRAWWESCRLKSDRGCRQGGGDCYRRSGLPVGCPQVLNKSHFAPALLQGLVLHGPESTGHRPALSVDFMPVHDLSLRHCPAGNNGSKVGAVKVAVCVVHNWYS